MKHLAVVVAGTGEIKDITIQPGTTAGDILRSIGLDGYVLSLDTGSSPLQGEEEVYSKVSDGAKTYASTPADAGAGVIPALAQLWTKIARSGRAQVIGTRKGLPRALRQKQPSVVVLRKKLPIWQEKRWKRNSNSYVGYYQVKDGRWFGEVRHPYTGEIEVFIQRPPASLQKHPHWHCFHYLGNGLHKLHFSQKPRDVDSAILLMERLIREVS